MDESAVKDQGSKLIQVELGQIFFPRKRVDGYLVEIRENGAMLLLSKNHKDVIRSYLPKPWLMYIRLNQGERPTLAHAQIVEFTPNDAGSLLCKVSFAPMIWQRPIIRNAIRLVRDQLEGVTSQAS